MFGIFPDEIVSLFAALLLGLFLGINREKSSGNSDFMGMRTMPLLALLGAASTMVETIPYLPVVGFVAIFIFLGIAYSHHLFTTQKPGMTSELSAMMLFFVGVFAGYQKFTIAILITIVLAGILGFKKELHRIAKNLSREEWVGALQLMIISGLVLPFLPNETVDTWGVLNPFKAWLLVIFISGIGFVGYFFMKFFGAKGGIPLMGFLGATVSSTAVSTSFAEQAKRLNHSQIFAVGIFVALGTMQIRVALEVFFVGGIEAAKSLIYIPLVMAASSFLSAFIFWFSLRKQKHQEAEKLQLDSPFELGPAIKFGAIYVGILFLIYFAQKYAGEEYLYLTSFLAGFVDVDAIVLSSMESLKNGTYSIDVARNMIFVALITNTFIKAVYTYILGTWELTVKVTLGVLFTGGIGIALLFV